MTYCLGITTREGLILASDSRTNAGSDDVSVYSKMHRFVQPGERVFVILCSGSLSLSQSVITLLDAISNKSPVGNGQDPVRCGAGRGRAGPATVGPGPARAGTRWILLQHPLHPRRPGPWRSRMACT